MTQEPDRTEAWVAIPSEAARRVLAPSGVVAAGYDYGFLPTMGRLLSAHKEICPAFSQLFRTIMFQPAHLSRQEKEMVAAIVAAAQDCRY